MHRSARVALGFVTAVLVSLCAVSAADAATLVAQDSFARTVSGGWGAASGGSWSVAQGPTSAFSVNGSTGLLATPPGYANQRQIGLGTKTLRDVDVTGKITIPSVTGTGASAFPAVMIRRQAAGHYRIGLQAFSTGKLIMKHMTGAGEVFAPDKDTGLSFAAGAYMVRVQATGANPTTIRTKVWRAGTAEPTAWLTDVKTTRGPQTAGTTGFRTSVERTPSALTFQIDDVKVTDITPPPADLTKWQLVESDEFNGTAVDTSKWTLYNAPGHGRNGLRRPAQVKVANGALTITAQMINGVLHSGGMVRKSQQTYGRYEFRIRTEADPSATTSGVALTWPADGMWPVHGENDIYETGIDTDRYPFHTFVHYDTDNKQKFYSHNVDGKQWHVMAMEWDAATIKIYRDGELVWTLADPFAIPDWAHKLAFQLDAMDPSMGAPVRMYVDWMKIYKKV